MDKYVAKTIAGMLRNRKKKKKKALIIALEGKRIAGIIGGRREQR